jgi:hypothetical protein
MEPGTESQSSRALLWWSISVDVERGVMYTLCYNFIQNMVLLSYCLIFQILIHVESLLCFLYELTW